jgi:signal transduction histidine kinase
MEYKGKTYVQHNSATVTKRLSEYAQRERNYIFHISSLKLLNPDNAPDTFERQALLEFTSRKKTELSVIEKIGDVFYFRYIAPLYAEKSCLECHEKQEHKVGDVMGAISVSVPMNYTFKIIESSRNTMFIGGVVTLVVLMLSLFFITRRMVINPINKMRSMMMSFSKDGNPEVPILRTKDELEDLSTSFREMADSIHSYQTDLQQKIENATQELKEKNESLLSLNKMKSDSIAKISHELRTPLTSIKGAMDYLSARLSMENDEKKEDLVEFLEVIKKNAERLIRLVNNVLDYERIELGQLAMHFREVNLKDILYEVVLGFKSQALEKDVAIQLSADDVVVSADEDRLKQVIVNLISNALNFSPPSSQILVTLKGDDDHAHVSVSDSGCGIEESEREMIFNQFYSKGVKNGAGLGLAICKGIIQAHSGTIGVKAGMNGGSCFFFNIPRTGDKVHGREKGPARR